MSPRNARFILIQAIATASDHPTTDDLITATGMARKDVSNNINAAINDRSGALIERHRDDVTGGPCYGLTELGRKWWVRNRPTDGTEKTIPHTLVECAKSADLAGVPQDIERTEHNAELLALITDIRAAIGDDGQIPQSELARRIHCDYSSAERDKTDLDALDAAISDFGDSLLPFFSWHQATFALQTAAQLIDAQAAHIARQESELIDLHNQVEILQQAHDAERAAREHYGAESNRLRELLDTATYVVRATGKKATFHSKEASAQKRASSIIRSGARKAKISILLGIACARRGVEFEASK